MTKTVKLKIPLTPEGDNWIWAHFMDHIFDKLVEEKLLKNDFDSGGKGAVFLRSRPYKKWQKANMGSVLMLEIVEVAQKNNLPVIIEEGIPYYVMEEKDAIMEFLKHG